MQSRNERIRNLVMDININSRMVFYPQGVWAPEGSLCPCKRRCPRRLEECFGAT